MSLISFSYIPLSPGERKSTPKYQPSPEVLTWELSLTITQTVMSVKLTLLERERKSYECILMEIHQHK